MKKLLLSLLIVSTISLNGQVLLSEDFNALNVGNVGTDVTGAIAGQGGWFQFTLNGTSPTTTNNSANSNFQIVSSGNSSKGLQLEGPNGDKGGKFLFKDGLGAVWGARTSGNNIIQVEVDINPGAGTTTSRNTFGVYIYNSALDKVLAGFSVRPATRELCLVAYSTPTGQTVGNNTYSLAAAPGIQIPANTFSRIGISFNKTTGQIIIKGPGIAAGGITLTGNATGDDPGEIDFASFSGNSSTSPNTSFTTAVFDNLVVNASATESLLSNKEISRDLNTVSIYPNPAKDILNIFGVENVTSLEINDINGRTIKIVNNATSVNVADLNAGVYFINITTDNGNVTKKFIKN